jgi:hypothetical protein
MTSLQALGISIFRRFLTLQSNKDGRKQLSI